MPSPVVISVIAIVLAIVALVVAVVSYRRVGARRAARHLVTAPGSAAAPEPLPAVTGDLVAFVANPTKAGASDLRDAAIRACAVRRMPEPLWFETTAADPGVGQARAAIARGAAVVVAVGGDGTVRAVAEALAGTTVEMGLIPQGTGNLLARNLDLPLTDTDEALRLALTGRGRTIDVGWLRVVRDGSGGEGSDRGRAGEETGGQTGSETGAETGAESGAESGEVPAEAAEATEPDSADPNRPDPNRPGTDRTDSHPDREHIFLVIAGLGFDAAMVADTDETLKARVGWIAYFVAGARHLHGHRARLRMQVDGDPTFSLRVRSLLIGNCGRLPGGIMLLPDAELDDGWLDIAAIDTRGGLAGWAQLFGEVVLQGVGVRTELPGKIGRIDHSRARELRVASDRPEAIQVDGDVLGSALEITARIDPGALTVRVGN